MSKAIWELEDGSRTSLNFYEHDADGNLINKYREFSDSLTSNQIYNYNDDGKLLVEYFQRSDSISGTVTYEYDSDGNLFKANCDGLAGWFFG